MHLSIVIVLRTFSIFLFDFSSREPDVIFKKIKLLPSYGYILFPARSTRMTRDPGSKRWVDLQPWNCSRRGDTLRSEPAARPINVKERAEDMALERGTPWKTDVFLAEPDQNPFPYSAQVFSFFFRVALISVRGKDSRSVSRSWEYSFLYCPLRHEYITAP